MNEQEIRDAIIEKCYKDLFDAIGYAEAMDNSPDHKQALDTLKEYALRAQIEPGWIKVCDRLPKIGVTCLGHTKTGRVMSVYVDKDGYWWSTGIGGASVTHWMPLPPAPKEGEQV